MKPEGTCEVGELFIRPAARKLPLYQQQTPGKPLR